jgi:plastocyanin
MSSTWGKSMKRFLAVLAVATVVTVTLVALRGDAGPEKVAFPETWKSGVLYATVDRYDTKQYRELYATPEAVQAAREGKPLPSGSVLTMVVHKAQVDAQGNPIKDANGRFVKGDVAFYAVMEKRTGWGSEYPDTLRNGEWEYSAFLPDQKFNDKANLKACFECHKPHAKIDYVISYERMAGRGTVAAATPASAPDVKIAGFAFGPSKLTAAAGKPVTWVNDDDSPHQVTVTKSGTRSAILTKGQSHTQSFDTPGTYEYICGLHPSMKGTIEVTQ